MSEQSKNLQTMEKADQTMTAYGIVMAGRVVDPK